MKCHTCCLGVCSCCDNAVRRSHLRRKSGNTLSLKGESGRLLWFRRVIFLMTSWRIEQVLPKEIPTRRDRSFQETGASTYRYGTSTNFRIQVLPPFRLCHDSIVHSSDGNGISTIETCGFGASIFLRQLILILKHGCKLRNQFSLSSLIISSSFSLAFPAKNGHRPHR